MDGVGSSWLCRKLSIGYPHLGAGEVEGDEEDVLAKGTLLPSST